MYSLKPIQIDVLFYAGLAAVIFTILPDLIEPATSWTHRAFGHSKRVLKGTFLVFLLFTLIALLFSYALVVGGAMLGYSVHLLADSTTPAGLPD
jgi:membrane-bound metal-dependent hydrolase YbcI (DUF457 family)